MANTFITPTMVARDASILLDDRLIVGNVVTRDKEAEFTANKPGDSIKVSIPPSFAAASEFTSSTSATDATETQIDLTLEKHFYVRVDLTSKQKSLELSDFTRLVTKPAIDSLGEACDQYILKQLQVFRATLGGAVANRPSTAAHIAALNKALNDNKVRQIGRVALVDTTVEASLLQLAQFTSVDYGADSAAGLRNATLGDRYGFRWLRDANLGAFSRSAAANDIAGSPAVDGTVAAGGTTLHIDGVTNAAGTIRAGCTFTIAGDSTRYVVRKDSTFASNEGDLVIYPALQAQATDDAAITFEAAGYMNLGFHPAAVSAAIVAPTPLAVNSAVERYNGLAVRVTMDSSISSLSDSIVYDVFVGCRVVNPLGGALFCG
jgi:hypothetical protein